MIPIKGLQKTTLVDYPGTLACTVFLGGCNFRCGYCYNADLVLRPAALPTMPEQDFFSFLESRKHLLEGVCITGGEPTLHPGLPEFCGRIREKGLKVKLDTNGTNPGMLKQLLDKKLVDYVAMDLKAPLERVSEAVGVRVDLSKLSQSIALLLSSPIDSEFRTTLIPDILDEAAIASIARGISGAKRYFLQQFRPAPTTISPAYQDMEPLSPSAVERMRLAAEQYVPTSVRNV